MLLRWRAVQDIKLPSYYEHLREAAAKAQPAVLATKKSHEAEQAPYGPELAPASGYAQADDSRSTPAGESSDGRAGLGSRGRPASGGGAAQGEYSQVFQSVNIEVLSTLLDLCISRFQGLRFPARCAVTRSRSPRRPFDAIKSDSHFKTGSSKIKKTKVQT
jgi:hypothetical protein